MIRKQETKEKTCIFYASDYHFEMVCLPYMYKEIEDNKEIIILTQNNLDETVKTLVQKINLEEIKKQKILALNWKNDDIDKIKELEKGIENKENIIVFIKGSEKYIKNTNEKINKFKGIQIIDCYDIEEVGEKTDTIMKNYKQILNTTGIKEIQKI